MNEAPIIVAEGLGQILGGQWVLRDVSLTLSPGEIVTIVGPNGSGKSTLVRLLIGALRPATGRVRRAHGLRIGYVPQRLSIDPTLPMTVGRDLEPRQMSELSGGQFQRALLAQAILRRPGLLVLDEAAQGLDQPGVAQFYRLVEELRRELGCAVLMVSHDLHVVMAASERVICHNGHVRCEGSPTVVSEAPEYRALFGFGTAGALALYRHEHDHAHPATVPAP
jgi:zinc transport system ATP-binding protein